MKSVVCCPAFDSTKIDFTSHSPGFTGVNMKKISVSIFLDKVHYQGDRKMVNS